MWAHLRHLGRRRAQLITAATALVQRIRDFLPVAWPTVTEVCAQPLEPVTWLAALLPIPMIPIARSGVSGRYGSEAA